MEGGMGPPIGAQALSQSPVPDEKFRGRNCSRGWCTHYCTTSRPFYWFWFSLGMTMLQLEWAIEYVFMNPLLLQNGLSAKWTSYAFLPSPVAQMILAPLLGHWSDKCSSRFGKRRPFIAFSMAMVVLFLGLVPFVESIGTGLGDPVKSTTSSTPIIRPITIAILIVCFCLADLMNSINEEFQRMIVTDVAVSKKDRMLGHSLMGALIGLGSGLGYLIGFIHFHAVGSLSGMGVEIFLGLLLFTPAMILHLALGGPGFHRRALQYHRKHNSYDLEEPSAALLPAPSVAQAQSSQEAATVADSSSDPLEHQDGSDEGNLLSEQPSRVLKDDTSNASPPPDHSLLKALLAARAPFLWMCLQQLPAWLGLWPIWQVATSYFGQLYGGDPNAPEGSKAYEDFQDGVRTGSLSLALLAFVTLGLSPIIPKIAKKIGVKVTYVISQLIAAVVLLLLHWVDNVPLSVIGIGLLGFSWSANNSIPFVLLPQTIPSPKYLAVYTSLLYNVQTSAQIVASVAIGPIVEGLGGSYSWALLIAAAGSAIGMFIALFRLPVSSWH